MKVPRPKPIRLGGRDTSGDECRVCGRHEHDHHDFEPPEVEPLIEPGVGPLRQPHITMTTWPKHPFVGSGDEMCETCGQDRNAHTLTTDRNDPRLQTGSPQQDAYLVLSDEERAKGFVRPVRRSYVHQGVGRCGTATTMGQALAETYARDVSFYGATYCAHCRGHFPVGEHGEFTWDDGSGEKVGT